MTPVQVRVTTHAWVPKSALSAAQLATLREVLTVRPKPGPAIGGERAERAPIVLYVETATHFGLPRGYYQRHRAPHHHTQLATSGGGVFPSALAFHGDLFPTQSAALDVVLQRFGEGSLGLLLEAATGWGKTTWAAALIAALGLPTLVCVHKEFLLRQWQRRFEKCLPEASVGIVRGKKLQFEGHHIVIGMMQTLCEHPFPEEFLAWPGLIVVDEAHRLGAQTFSKVVPRFPAKHYLGLSGTFRRKDGAEQVFTDVIGDVAFSHKAARMVPKVFRTYSKFRLPERVSPRFLSRPTLIKRLTSDAPRNAIIHGLLVDAATKGRKLLVVSERLEHLATMEEALRVALPSVTTGFYVGNKTEAELDAAAEAQVVFATVQLVSEGLDIPALDTLFLTTPVSDPEQVAGRILRPFEGKQPPIIVDVRDDNVSMLKYSGSSRDEWYASCGW